MAIIRRKTTSGASRYVVRARDTIGRWYPSKTFERRCDAERYERELETFRDQGVASSPRESRELITEAFFTSWSENRAHQISKGWHASILRMAKTYILPVIGHRRLAEIQPQHVGEIMAAMAKENLSAQTMLHVYATLRQMFSDAVEYYGILSTSPVMKRDRPKLHRTERDYLTPDESWILLRASQSHYLAPAIWISILSGLRPSEVQALRWSSVNFDKKHILIREAYKRAIQVIEPFPKQKDWGFAPMPAALQDFLKPRSVGQNPDGFVATALRGGMLEQKKLHDGLRKLCIEAGLKPISPHELRHSCTEIWFSSGASLEDVRRVLNHKSAETTQRYVHRSDDRILGIAELITMPTPSLKLVL